jgi:hypothetical protein
MFVPCGQEADRAYILGTFRVLSGFRQDSDLYFLLGCRELTEKRSSWNMPETLIWNAIRTTDLP